jgi:pimeloyl-ACP methyl ester carboxylesterase
LNRFYDQPILVIRRKIMKQNESNAPKFRRSLLRVIIAVIFILPMLFVGASARAQASKANDSAQTIVLVHGAWADSAGWTGVISRLQSDGYKVWAVPNPLRGVSPDAAYVASVLNTIPGPIVLVAHSYGGFVITNAATGNPNVKALVYIDGFAPDEGETGFQLLAMTPPPGQSISCVSPDVLNFVPYPGAQNGDVDLYIKQEAYPSCFANTIAAKQAAVLAASQRPITFSAGTEPSGPPAWKTIPSWYLVGTLDHVIPPYVQIFMAERANAHIVQVKAPHPAMISNPQDVAALIETAAQAVATP